MPELLVNAVRERFDDSGHPRSLHLLQVASVGDGKGRGMYVHAITAAVSTDDLAPAMREGLKASCLRVRAVAHHSKSHNP